MKLPLLASGLIALSLSQTQAPARNAAAVPAPPTGTAAMSGAVRDEEDKPVRRATVTINGDMRLERMTISDDAGRFSFDQLPSGRYTVTAEKEGYPSMSYGAKRPFRAGSGLSIEDGQALKDVVLRLARGAVLTGIVYDEVGQPLPGMLMMAWQIRNSLSGERTLDSALPNDGGVVTDDRGMYRIFGLPPGEYTVGTYWAFSGRGADVRVPTDEEIRAAFQAAKTGAPAATAPAVPGAAPTAASRARYNYAPVFAPGVIDPLTAATWTLAPGEERTGIDVRMQFQARAAVEGIAILPGGSPSGTFTRLSLSRRNRLQGLNSTRVFGAGPDGRFTATGLGPDLYTLMAEVRGSDTSPPLWALADLNLNPGETASVTLTLQPTPTLNARVVFQGDTLLPPADLSTVTVRLWTVGRTFAQTTSQTDKGGAVTIGGIVPGRYAVVGNVPGPAAAQGKPRWSVRSVMLGDRDVTDLPIEITSTGMPDLTVTFTDVVSELSGTLTTASGQPATDAFVVVMPADKEYWFALSRRIASTRPDRSGRYVFRGLPAGEYRVAVTTDLTTGELQDANALAQLAAQSAPVTMTTGEKRVLDLRMAVATRSTVAGSETEGVRPPEPAWNLEVSSSVVQA